MIKIDDWSLEYSVDMAISTIIDLEQRYFMVKTRINKAIEYLRLSNPAHWGSENEIELLKILGDINE